MNSTLDQLAEIAKAHPRAVREVLRISLDAIRPDPDQPRKDPGDLTDLATSIEAIGIQQPLLVRPDPASNGSYVLVAGERRLLAASKAGKDPVPCIVLDDLDDPARRLVVQLTENIQRSDLDMMEIARTVELLLDELEISKKDVARLLGKHPSYISKHLALLEAAGPAEQALNRGLIESPETFRLFSKLPEGRQQAILRRSSARGAPISRSEVEGQSQSVEPRSAAAKRPDGSPSVSLRLSSVQVERIIVALGGRLPENPGELKAALLSLL